MHHFFVVPSTAGIPRLIQRDFLQFCIMAPIFLGAFSTAATPDIFLVAANFALLGIAVEWAETAAAGYFCYEFSIILIAPIFAQFSRAVRANGALLALTAVVAIGTAIFIIFCANKFLAADMAHANFLSQKITELCGIFF